MTNRDRASLNFSQRGNGCDSSLRRTSEQEGGGERKRFEPPLPSNTNRLPPSLPPWVLLEVAFPDDSDDGDLSAPRCEAIALHCDWTC